jgi:ComEC/Rec2-related protein
MDDTPPLLHESGGSGWRLRIRSAHVAAVCLGFLFGVALASLELRVGAQFSVLGALWGGVLLVIAMHQWMKLPHSIVAIALLALLFGVVRVRMNIGEPIPGVHDGATITVEGQVTHVRATTSGRIWATLKHVATVQPSGSPERTKGSVSMTWVGQHDVRYGDVVRASCSLHIPDTPRDMLTNRGTCVMHSGEVDIMSRDHGSMMRLAIDDVHRSLVAQLHNVVIGPSMNVLASALLGVRSAVTSDLSEVFRRSGTLHVLVVSGWHMSFLGFAVFGLLQILFSRRSASIGALCAIAILVVFAGFTPSAIRGALMTGVIIVVQSMGRVGNAIRTLFIVGTMMVVVHPSILAFDLAFQLSFIATLGIIVASKLFQRVTLPGNMMVRELGELVIVSAAAAAITAPLVMGTFGTISVIGPLVNVVVLLILPALLLSGGALLGLSYVLPAVVPVGVWVVTALGEALLVIVTTASQVSWSTAELATMDWWMVLGVYAIGGTVIFRICDRRGVRAILPDIALAANPDRSPGTLFDAQ